MTVTTDRFETNMIINETEGCFSVWSEREDTFLHVEKAEFLEVWRHLHATWLDEYGRTGFLFGCGRETMAYWVYKVTGTWYPANYLRTILEVGAALEWTIPTTDGTYWRFPLRPIRYEHLL